MDALGFVRGHVVNEAYASNALALADNADAPAIIYAVVGEPDSSRLARNQLAFFHPTRDPATFIAHRFKQLRAKRFTHPGIGAKERPERQERDLPRTAGQARLSC